MDGLSASDVALLSGGYGNERNSGFMGDDMWAFLIFALIFGWGGNGFGGFGGRGGGYGTMGLAAEMNGIATRADINEAFALNGINNGIESLKNGQTALQQSLCNDFNSVNTNLMQLGQNMQNCCCTIERGIDGINYNMAKNTCDITGAIKDTNYLMSNGFNSIIQNTHNDTDRILAKLDQMETARLQEKNQALRDENQTLKFQISQTAQNGYIDAIGNSIVARLQQPTPVPSYTVPAPYPYSSGCGCYNNTCC